MVLSPKIVFSALVMRFFGKKNQKTLNVVKLRKFYEVFFREKKFKSLVFKNGKAQNMPVVAGRFVDFSTARTLGLIEDQV